MTALSPNQAIPGPNQVLIDFIVLSLAPHYLSVTGNDADSARTAALDAIAPYRDLPASDLLLAAQSVALGLAALDSVRLAAQSEDVPQVALRLRANALSLTRTAAQVRKTLDRLQPASPQPQPDPEAQAAAPQPAAQPAVRPPAQPAVRPPAQPALQRAAEPAAPLAAQPGVAPPAAPPDPQTAPPAGQHDAAWAAAFADIAQEVSTDLPNLSSRDQQLAQRRLQALASTASALTTRPAVPPQ